MSVILPVVAPVGTVAVTRPSFTKANDAEVPLNRTPLTAVKWFPLIVTVEPIGPFDGEKLLIVGALLPVTVKSDALVAVPVAVVSVILPVVAPVGTVAVTLPSFTKANAAEVPLNRTPLTPVKWFPLIVTVAPIAPLDGENLLIVGALLELTVKFAALVVVPDVVVSWIFPVVAPDGHRRRHLCVRLEVERRGGSVEPHAVDPREATSRENDRGPGWPGRRARTR